MARSIRTARLETRSARLKLPQGNRIFATIGEGLALGYRRTEKGYGTWTARHWTGSGYNFIGLGEADDYRESNGENVLTFYQAQEKARTVSAEAKRGSKEIKQPITVAKAAENYMIWYRENRRAINETQHTIAAHILPTFTNRIVSDLSTKEIRDWHNKLASLPVRRRSKAGEEPTYGKKAQTVDEKRARKATANRILTVFKAILNKAFHDDLVDDDTTWRKVKPFERADEPITRFLTESESVRLINACRPDFRQLAKAALFTGARYGELTRLKASDINTDTGMIYISPEAKSGKGRHVPLSDEGLDFFKTAIAGKLGTECVFLKNNFKRKKQDGKWVSIILPPTAWGKNHHVRLLEEACIAAKIEPGIGFHELRHTYASLLAQAGADLLTISKLLGHADTRITSRHYAHLCDKTLSNTVKNLLPGFGHNQNKKVTQISPRITK